jgi:glutamate racemase
LKEVISRVMGDNIALVDSAQETAKEIKKTLIQYDMVNTSASYPQRRFYVTDSPERFIKVGERFLGEKIEYIEKINIGG